MGLGREPEMTAEAETRAVGGRGGRCAGARPRRHRRGRGRTASGRLLWDGKKPLFFRDTGQLDVGTDAGDRNEMTRSYAWRGGKGQRERGHFMPRACVLPH